MTVRKLTDGKSLPWMAELYPQGRDGPRKRKRFATKGEALGWERWILEQAGGKPWQDGKRPETDERRLSDLVALWHSRHGQSLTAGEKIRRKLELMCEAIGDPLAVDFGARHFAEYRDRRLSGEVMFSGQSERVAGPGTLNAEQNYLHAMFNELIRLGEFTQQNPISGMRNIRLHESEMAYLTGDEIVRLMAECERSRNPDLPVVVRLCLATGARWSEVQELSRSNVTPYRLTFVRTKGKRNRTVPITPELFELIPTHQGRLFCPCYDAFEHALGRAGIQLPAGQLTHVLRHTFASHFMMRGGNILVLQRILGHKSITMTMRYAHFAPEHLDDAIRLNPLAALDGGKMAAENDNDRR